ncbi:DUF1109 domain-containing protein [Rhizobium sp. OAE497]|uniref:NrsF family protein n=1 Tax=Rhizobium sp. OAE497 TaxID=2663796 RepID=UPI0018F3C80B
MKSAQDTSALIRSLAREATEKEPPQGLRFHRLLLLAAGFSLMLSIALALGVFGIRPNLPAVLAGTPFLFKFATMLLLAAGGLALVRRAAEPGTGSSAWMMLIPGFLVLAMGLALDSSGFPLLGRHGGAVPSCVGAIVLLSLPALAAGLGVLKRGVPVQPLRAGLAAGFLAGTIGGAAYAFVCKNDGALFVAIWYGLAIVIVATLGALIGRKALAW